MRIVNYTEFRNNLSENLNAVNEDAEVVIVSRGKGKNVVLISLDEYNAMKETMYLMESKPNRQRLDDAIKEMDAGKYKKNKLAE